MREEDRGCWATESSFGRRKGGLVSRLGEWLQVGCLAAATSGGVFGAGCATPAGRSVERATAAALVSSEQENQIGLQVKSELEQKQNVKYITDPGIADYVVSVAQNVIRFGQKDRSDVQWQVHVIDDPKTVNAFATPGGFLYVYSGLLASAENEAELAGVMAHETGHVVARHSARSMVAAYGLEAVVGLASGSNPGLLTQLGANIGAQGLMLAHSRADETEADEYGARYASAAGYDPNALITFFQKLQAQEGHTPKLLAYLSDHPATGDRIAHLQSYIAKNGLNGNALNAGPYAQMKARLAARPSQAGAPPSPGAPPPPPAAGGRSTGGGAPPPAPPAPPPAPPK